MAFLAPLAEGLLAGGAEAGAAGAAEGGMLKNLGGLFGGHSGNSKGQFQGIPNFAEGNREYHMDSGAQ